MKTDSLGNIQWQNTIGGSADDQLYSVQQTADGGYIVGGYSYSNISGDKTENSWNNTSDYWIVKTDASGNIQWQNTIGGSGSDELSQQSIVNSQLLLYPNPAKDELIVNCYLLSGKNEEVKIYDLFGRYILKSQIVNQTSQIKINISGFSQGVYFVEVQSGEKILRGKFLKE